jgi:nodulation protein E
MHRVVITGVGIISALGNDRETFVGNLRAGRSAIRPWSAMPDGLTVRVGAEVGEYGVDRLSEKQVAFMDRVSQFAVLAARDAIAQSGLDFRSILGLRSAAIIGSGAGGMTTLDTGFHRLYAEGAKRLAPMTVPRLMMSACASQISIDTGIRGPSYVISSACASANHAIGTAFQMVRSGMIETAVTGGAEACLTFGTLKGWEAIRVLAPDTCRPFSLDRKGLVLGEGAAIFVLETMDYAVARGAEILGELVGFGMSSDAGDIVAPSLDGACRAIVECLNDADIDPECVEYVNAHGTGTTANDHTETLALHYVFGRHAQKLAVSSTKSMHGHALGAAGALELAATVLSMKDGFIPPTANYTQADPDCDLDYVPNEARSQKVRTAISNSFAFGGLNAVLAVRSFDPSVV